MTAFNEIVFDAPCPVCGATSEIVAQLHIAASFSGDLSGRFCNRTYRLGDTLSWWPPGDSRFAQWRDGTLPGCADSEAREACYAECRSCAAELGVVLTVVDLKPIQVLDVFPEDSWPPLYPR